MKLHNFRVVFDTSEPVPSQDGVLRVVRHDQVMTHYTAMQLEQQVRVCYAGVTNIKSPIWVRSTTTEDNEMSEEKKETKPECLHNFVPVEADNQGNASTLKCTKCGKKMIKG